MLPWMLGKASAQNGVKGRTHMKGAGQERAVSHPVARTSSAFKFAVAAAAAAVAASAFASPAVAGPRCSDGALCLWKGKDYTGAKYKVTEPGELEEVPKAFNNKVSSLKNKWEWRAFVYENKDGTGQAFCLESGEKIPDLSAFLDEINNDISSARLATGPGSCGP